VTTPSATAPALSPRASETTTAVHQRRPDIQGLRALAVVLVIGNHAGVPGFSGGFIGVDVFFVISGYVITQLLLREVPHGIRRGLPDFYCRRIRRIVPAATATLIVTLVASDVVLGSRTSPLLAGDVRWASVFAANVRLISTGSNYFVPGIHPSLVTHFWSLAVEEQFYLVWPVVVFATAHVAGPRHRLRALTVALAVGIGLSAWWSLHTSVADPVAAYYSPFTRFWELGLGCFLATVTPARPARSVRNERVAAGLGVALLVVALWTLSASSVYPGWHAWLPCASAALFIWAGAGAGARAGTSGGRTAVTRLLSTRPLGYVGDLSYSLYLAHYPWIELSKQATWLNGWDWRLVAGVGTVACALCSFHLIEDPVRRSPTLASDRVAVLLVLGVCIAASWAAAYSIAT
jgi:peptidoglycan/LPS O-acetylase OafA/YrhL